MKNILFLLFALLVFSSQTNAGDKNKKTKTAKTTEAAIDTSEIKWMTIDEVQVAMKKEPRKVFMDVYTDWCGWCKVMDKKTFTNKELIKYLNTKFYSVKLNAEHKDEIRFMGKMYKLSSDNRTHELAVELLKGYMSYPSTIVMEENFQNPQAIQGFQEASFFEVVLKYLGENIYKTQGFEDFKKEYSTVW